MKSVYLDENGNEISSVELHHLWAKVYAMFLSPWGKHKDSGIWKKCIIECLDQADSNVVGMIWTRIYDDEFAVPLIKVFEKLGFTRSGFRIEYKTPIELLPLDEGTPFLWKRFSEMSWTKKDLIHFVNHCGEGDPDFEEEDFTDDWFENESLSSGPDTISIGYINGEPIAVSVVQIDEKDGWSRISYMGIVKEARRNGYGAWVHRRGFSEIKNKGGKLYHGGTNKNNTAMIRLFEKHNCRHFAEYQEWSLHI